MNYVSKPMKYVTGQEDPDSKEG